MKTEALKIQTERYVHHHTVDLQPEEVNEHGLSPLRIWVYHTSASQLSTGAGVREVQRPAHCPYLHLKCHTFIPQERPPCCETWGQYVGNLTTDSSPWPCEGQMLCCDAWCSTLTGRTWHLSHLPATISGMLDRPLTIVVAGQETNLATLSNIQQRTFLTGRAAKFTYFPRPKWLLLYMFQDAFVIFKR